MNGTATAPYTVQDWQKEAEMLDTAKVKRLKQAFETLAEWRLITSLESWDRLNAISAIVYFEHDKRVNGRRRHVKALEDNPDFF